MAGLPRLTREEELALCEDVQRWQRLERLRQEISVQPGSAMDGGARRKIGLEEWASAAGISVEVRSEEDGGTRQRARNDSIASSYHIILTLVALQSPKHTHTPLSPCFFSWAQDLRVLVDRGTGARERLVLSHVRLVMFLAAKRGGRTALSSMDLIQVRVCVKESFGNLPRASSSWNKARVVLLQFAPSFILSVAHEMVESYGRA